MPAGSRRSIRCDAVALADAPTLRARVRKTASGTRPWVRAHCLCGTVTLEILFPAFWAWHDHSEATRRAHSAAYATYVGCWRKNVRICTGERHLRRFREPDTRATRAFCARCGSPVYYERKPGARMLDIPRALFDGRTGREPRYHQHLDERCDWAYTGAPLAPLKGYPGVFWERPKRCARAKAPPLAPLESVPPPDEE